jgi:exodeoxyribonuclease VII small subunit
MTTTAAAMKDISFEDALAELETIVRDLESGKTTLEKSIAAYERGMTLKALCESKLREAQARIEKIIITPDGSMGVAPLDPDQ